MITTRNSDRYTFHLPVVPDAGDYFLQLHSATSISPLLSCLTLNCVLEESTINNLKSFLEQAPILRRLSLSAGGPLNSLIPHLSPTSTTITSGGFLDEAHTIALFGLVSQHLRSFKVLRLVGADALETKALKELREDAGNRSFEFEIED